MYREGSYSYTLLECPILDLPEGSLQRAKRTAGVKERGKKSGQRGWGGRRAYGCDIIMLAASLLAGNFKEKPNVSRFESNHDCVSGTTNIHDMAVIEINARLITLQTRCGLHADSSTKFHLKRTHHCKSSATAHRCLQWSPHHHLLPCCFSRLHLNHFSRPFHLPSRQSRHHFSSLSTCSSNRLLRFCSFQGRHWCCCRRRRRFGRCCRPVEGWRAIS